MGASILDKTSPFSPPAKPSPKLTSSVDAKENRLTSPCVTNQMRSSTKKNFMSPTISASSKTVAHRKKILAERNSAEANDPTCAKFHHRRSSSSFDLNQGSVDISASTDSLTLSINDQINSVEDGVDDAKLKPYDPVHNYCSPRPKFLLYKPDRRSEILRRYEMIDVTSSESESSVEQDDCLVKQNVEVTEAVRVREIVKLEEELVANPDEDVDRSVKVINEEMSVDHTEVRQSIENHSLGIKDLEKDGEMVKDLNLINQLEFGTSEIKFEAMEPKDDEMSVQVMETEDEDEEGEFEEEGEVEMERYLSFKSLLKFWLVIVVLGLSTLYLSSMNSISVGFNCDELNVLSDLRRAPLIHDNASGYVIQDELAKMGFEEASHRIKSEIIIRKLDAGSAEVFEADEVEAAEDESDLPSVENVTEAGNAGDIVREEMINVEENTTPEVVIQSEETETETEKHDPLTEVVEPHSEACKAACHEIDVLADVNYQTEVTSDETVAIEDSTGDGILNNFEEVVSINDEETVKTAVAVVCSSLFAVIGFLGFQKLKRTNNRMQEESVSEPEPDDHFTNSLYSKREADHFNNGVLGAPRVQLLGEYTVGSKDVNSYSFSSASGTPLFIGESSERRSHKKEVPTSSIDSPSYGSFTAEMMFRTKEEARGGGGEKVIVTPVRRSSRIQSRRTPGASQ